MLAAEGIWPEAGWSRGGLSKRRSRRGQISSAVLVVPSATVTCLSVWQRSTCSCARAYGQAGWSRGGLSRAQESKGPNLLSLSRLCLHTVTCSCRVAVKSRMLRRGAYGQRQVGQEEGCANVGVEGPKISFASWLCLQHCHMLCRVAVKRPHAATRAWPGRSLVERRAVQAVGVEGPKISFAVLVVPSGHVTCRVVWQCQTAACCAEGIWPEGVLVERRAVQVQVVEGPKISFVAPSNT